MSEEKQRDILFSDFGKIILKIIIGLASFQLLAPIIWNYLSDLLHLRKLFSLNIIILIYFILPIIMVLVWWRNSRSKFIALSNPPVTDHNPSDIPDRILNSSRTFIRISDFILFFLLVANIMLLLFPVEPASVIYTLQAIYFAALIVLIIASHRITESYFLGLDDFSSVLKAQKNRYRLFRLTFYCIFGLIAAMEFQYLFGRDYLSKSNERICDTNTIRSSTELHNAFRIVDLKNSLSDARGKLEAELERLQQMQALQQVNNLNYRKEPLQNHAFITPASFTNSFSPSGIIFPTGKDSVYGENFFHTFFRLAALSNFVDSASEVLTKMPDDIEIAEPPYDFEAILELHNLPSIRDSAIAPSKRILWYEASIGIIKNIELNMNSIARTMVSKILSNLQMKGIFSFLTLMVFLMCIYVFLKINGEILSIVSSEPGKKGDDELKKLKGYSDENLGINKRMTESVWLYMTIMLGLLIPLLKPVDPEKLNLDNPFKIFTAAGQIQSYNSASTDNHAAQTTIDSSITITINYVGERNYTGTGIDESIINEILRNTKTIKDSVVQARMKYNLKQIFEKVSRTPATTPVRRNP